MARTDPQINIRIPAELKEQIEAAAAAKKRSMIAEIVDRLEVSFRNEQLFPLDRDPKAIEEAIAFAVGRVLEQKGFLDKLAEKILGRAKKDSGHGT